VNDDLLSYYNRELTHLRHQASRFAQAHPKVAARLRLGADGSEDPHVERLLEGFAYLTARIRGKLDDEFPEISRSILGTLYPHYLAPIPSCSIVQLELDSGQNELLAGLSVARGQAIETEPVQGEPCRFQTCYPVRLLPVDVKQAQLVSAPFTAPATPVSKTAAAVLRISLKVRAAGAKWGAIPATTLRFYLDGQNQNVHQLHELIFRNVVGVAFATGPDDKSPVLAKPDAIRPVGYELSEGLLPYPTRSFLGYRLLTEYFAFPRKFQFVDFAIPPHALARCEGTFEIFLYLNRTIEDLEPHVGPTTFRLGCTPMVNLYSRTAEPIRLSQADYESQIVPDLRRPAAHEIYSIDRVTATYPDGRTVDHQPLFSAHHGRSSDGPFWHSSRRGSDSLGTRTDGGVDRGSEVFLSFVDRGFDPRNPANATIHVQATCMNRDLPSRLPFGGGQPKLQLGAGGPPVKLIRCLTAPTPTLRRHLFSDNLWRLVSHLNLNHLSITDKEQGAAALREILNLYDFADSPETRSQIEGIVSVESRRATGRIQGAICRGVEVGLTLDEDRFSTGGIFLFASVIDRFLSMYSSVNSFTRTVATLARRSEEYHRWPVRVGEQTIL
jgi:type VI secretion system protein ImpG